jgi:hypothetical protein
MLKLAHSVMILGNGSREHSIMFEFGLKYFEAVVVEKADASYVAECMLLKNNEIIEIDIPTFFGSGYSPDIFAFLYAQADEDKDDEDAI